jgi:hypothetical protein
MLAKISELALLGSCLFAAIKAEEDGYFMIEKQAVTDLYEMSRDESGFSLNLQLHQGLLLGSFVLSTLISFIALGLAWWATAFVYLNVSIFRCYTY